MAAKGPGITAAGAQGEGSMTAAVGTTPPQGTSPTPEGSTEPTTQAVGVMTVPFTAP